MKTLIVPTDFSPASVNAMKYAVDMALAIDASIYLYTAYELPIIYNDMPIPPITADELKRMNEERLEQLKNSIIRISAGKINVFTEARLGNPVHVSEELCNSVQPFAVIMGSHGSTGLEGLIMGSNTLQAIRRLKFPVIVVPPGTTFRNIKKIGLACDFKNVTESIPFELIKNIVHEFGGELHIMHIGDTDQQPLIDEAWLETMLDDIKPYYHFVKGEDVVSGINEIAEANNFDLVTIIPKNHNLAEKLFHTSNSKELVTHSHIPIVSIHE
jgi:nucleotide-binding universal stress UspA family protein